jgi:hypothetical protein
MDLEKIRQGLQLMVGRHDFRNFCKMNIEKVHTFERKILKAEVVETGKDDVCYLQISGQAFLWHQIRCIASILFLVGEELEPPSIVGELLDVAKCPGKPSYPLAPEFPLVLHHCGYPNVEFGHSVQNMWNVYSHLERQREDLVLAEARIRNCQSRLSESSVALDDLTSFVLTRLKFRQRKSGDSYYKSVDEVQHPFGETKSVLWSEALAWLKESYDLVPDLQGAKDSYHSPLLGRAKGTTYDEKVAALKDSSKRLQRYEDNVIKKRQTKEVVHAFDTPLKFLEVLSSSHEHNNNSIMVVKYYASYCKICQRTGINYKKIAMEQQQTQARQHNDEHKHSIEFHELDAGRLPSDTLKQLGVTKFPFCQIFFRGDCVASFGLSTGAAAHLFGQRVRDTLDACLARTEEEWETFRIDFAGPRKDNRSARDAVQEQLMQNATIAEKN